MSEMKNISKFYAKIELIAFHCVKVEFELESLKSELEAWRENYKSVKTW